MSFNPYDPESALNAIRPRMAQVKARRRRAVGATTAIALLTVSSVAAAAVLSPSEPSTSVVAVSPDSELRSFEDLDLDLETSEQDSSDEELDRPGAGADQEGASAPDAGPDNKPVEDAPPATEAPKPPATDAPKPPAPDAPKPSAPTTEAPKPTTTTTAPAQSQTHTFTYPGTGSVTVTQTGNKLSFVSASAQSGWTHHVSHNQHDLIGVEYKNGNVQRWLKVRIVNGVAVAEQHEQVACAAPAGGSTHQAPSGSGSVSVNVNESGKLTLVGSAPTADWTAEVLYEKHDAVKVRFIHSGGSDVWIIVQIVHCQIDVVTSAD